MSGMSSLTASARPYIRAVLQVAVTAATYLVGVLQDGGTLGDLTIVQWLAGFLFVAASFGITQSAYRANPPAPPAPVQE